MWVLTPFFHLGFGPTHTKLTKEFTSLMTSLQLPLTLQASFSFQSSILGSQISVLGSSGFLDIDPKKRKRVEINVPFLIIQSFSDKKKFALTSVWRLSKKYLSDCKHILNLVKRVFRVYYEDKINYKKPIP